MMDDGIMYFLATAKPWVCFVSNPLLRPSKLEGTFCNNRLDLDSCTSSPSLQSSHLALDFSESDHGMRSLSYYS